MEKKLKIAILAITDCEEYIVEIFNLGEREKKTKNSYVN
jgi:hypothetical protein